MAATEQERNEFIRKCIAEGMNLSKVQDALNDQLGIHMTYMELRMLTSELSVSWEAQDKKAEAAKPRNKPAEQPQKQAEEAQPAEAETLPQEGDDDAAAEGDTKIEISPLMRPGTALSGTVTFASGASGEWYVDQRGRLGLMPAEGSAKPTQDDIQKFQIALQEKLQAGY